MNPAVLRVNDVVELVAEPLTPFMVGASEVIVYAEFADDGSGKIEQPNRLVEHEGRHQRIRRPVANIKRAGTRDVVGAELCFPGGGDHVLGDIDPVIGISAFGILEHVRRSEPVCFRDLPWPDGQLVPGCPYKGVARFDFDNMVQQDTLQLRRVWEPGSNVRRWRKRSLVSLLRHV